MANADRQLARVEEYVQTLNRLEAAVDRNTAGVLEGALEAILRDLRRAYNAYLNATRPNLPGPDGEARLPGTYTTAEASTRFRSLLKVAEQYLPAEDVKAWSQQFTDDLTAATQIGGDAASDLYALATRATAAPFAGARPQTINAAVRVASAFIEGESGRFRQQIVQIVGEGVARGWGSKRLERQIRQALDGAEDPNGITQRIGLKRRAQLIARSEVANAYGQGQIDWGKSEGLRYVRSIATEDERTCPACMARHGRIFPVDQVPAAWHVMCVLGDTPVSVGTFAGATRATYRGDVIAITLADGSRLTVTANHPMLTTSGWVNAEALRQGDQLVGEIVGGGAGGDNPDLDEMPATAEEVFTALATSGAVTAVSVPVAPLDLHGDGQHVKGDVSVVRADGLLQCHRVASDGEGMAQGQGSRGSIKFVPFSGLSRLDALCLGLNAASRGVMSRLSEAETILLGGLTHSEKHRLAAVAWSDPRLVEPVGNDVAGNPVLTRKGFDTHPFVKQLGNLINVQGGQPGRLNTCTPEPHVDDLTGNAKLLGEFIDRHASLVAVHDVVNIKRNPFHGWVYSFETFCGAFSIGSTSRILTGNCRCTLVSVPNEAVEEPDPVIRDELLDSEFWRQQQADGVAAYAEGKGITIQEAEKQLARALRTPTGTEKFLRPGDDQPLRPVVALDAPAGGRTFEEAITEREARKKET